MKSGRFALMKNIPLFSELSSVETDDLVKLSQSRKYPRGNIVLYKGDVGDVIYIILKGRVKVVLSSPDGKEIILSTLNTGEYFGEMALFDHLPRSANIVTMEDCDFLVIPQEVIIDLIKKSPQLALKMISIMSARLRDSNEQISSLAHLDVKGRVARTLLKLSKKASKKTKDGYQMIPRPSAKDIADMSGASRETVSRILTEFARQGLISLSKNHIVVYEELVESDDLIEN